MRSLFFLLISSVSFAGSLKVVDGRFVDAQGSTVILRGVNVAGNSKVPDFRPADPKIFPPLAKWGLNVVRLLFTWEAYEPQPGQYDDSYLAYYRAAIEAAWAQNIYTVVDMHQDGFSRYLAGGCGEGFPEWAIPSPVPRATPVNDASCVKWGTLVLGDDGVKAAWDALYSDSEGARTRYLAMLARVAAALKDEPGVIGYDLLNEPAGDEATQIGPFYELAGPAVRSADPTAILFISPRQLTGGGLQTDLPKPSFDNVAYSPHYYDPGIYLYAGWNGTEPDEPFMFMTSTAESWGAALFLGEFGAPPSLDMLLPYMDTMYRHLDDALASAAQWAYTPGWTPDKKDGWNLEDFSIVDDQGALRENFHPRPFARRVAGIPTKLTVKGDELTLEFTPGAGTTEIFAPTGSADGCKRQGNLLICSGTKTIHVTPDQSCGLTGAEALLLGLVAAWMRRRSRRKAA